MILARAPLRISFFGGGSDIPSFYKAGIGGVVSMAIDKYMHVAINTPEHNVYKIVYSQIETTNSIEDIKHNIVRETLKKLTNPGKFEMSVFADVPSKGTGLGSSSSLCVALIRAMEKQLCKFHTKHEIAELASDIEINKCGEPIGKQDQYAAAFGGLNQYIFEPNGTTVIPINASYETISTLTHKGLLFYTGTQRKASDILKHQFDNPEANHWTRETVSMSHKARFLLEQGDVDSFIKMLDAGWEIKKLINPYVSNSEIDDAYKEAKKLGVVGGKVLGAGGGGYLLLYPDLNHHNPSIIIEAMRLRGFKYFSFNMDTEGAKVVYNGTKF
jgi:D-glycero-alpha-D-manno-heptose-7-phosphate kinase